MHIPVHSVADLGLALRATRKGTKVRLDDLAVIAGVSKQFVSDVEYGKQTVQLGLVLKLLDEMGLRLPSSRRKTLRWVSSCNSVGVIV